MSSHGTDEHLLISKVSQYLQLFTCYVSYDSGFDNHKQILLEQNMIFKSEFGCQTFSVLPILGHF